MVSMNKPSLFEFCKFFAVDDSISKEIFYSFFLIVCRFSFYCVAEASR